MKCSLAGCTGQYEPRLVIHTIRHEGRVVVIDHVPAEVCPACGDILFTPATVRAIERMLESRSAPDASVPLYEFA